MSEHIGAGEDFRGNGRADREAAEEKLCLFEDLPTGCRAMRAMSPDAVQTQSYPLDRNLILTELERTLAAISEPEIAAAQEMILTSNRLFVMGAGRTGLALKMAAMRLMHLGLVVHVAGEVTTPAIGPGDLLLVASGSGATAGPVYAAAHMIVGGSDGTAYGGHLLEARVRPTCELVLTESPVHLLKKLDPESGLALIQI